MEWWIDALNTPSFVESVRWNSEPSPQNSRSTRSRLVSQPICTVPYRPICIIQVYMMLSSWHSRDDSMLVGWLFWRTCTCTLFQYRVITLYCTCRYLSLCVSVTQRIIISLTSSISVMCSKSCQWCDFFNQRMKSNQRIFASSFPKSRLGTMGFSREFSSLGWSWKIIQKEESSSSIHFNPTSDLAKQSCLHPNVYVVENGVATLVLVGKQDWTVEGTMQNPETQEPLISTAKRHGLRQIP